MNVQINLSPQVAAECVAAIDAQNPHFRIQAADAIPADPENELPAMPAVQREADDELLSRWIVDQVAIPSIMNLIVKSPVVDDAIRNIRRAKRDEVKAGITKGKP